MAECGSKRGDNQTPLTPDRPHPNPLPEGPEGEGTLVLDIPARYTPDTRTLPTAEEVEPWVQAIIRLWDDAGFYEQASRRAR
jgi:hypothetical protein